MKIKNTIIAFVLLLALGGIFYYLNNRAAADQGPKQDLFSFKPDQVQEITVDTPPDAPATIRRASSGKDWEVVVPDGVAPDNAAIQSFLDQVSTVKVTPLEGDNAPVWADYGLDKGTRTFQFKLKDGKTESVSTGIENPGGSSKYARKGDSSTVYMVDDVEGKPLFEDSLLTFRDKRILPVDLDQAQRVEVHIGPNGNSPAQHIVITKQAGGDWNLDEPKLRTDHGATSYLVSTLSTGQIKSVPAEKPDSLQQFGLDKPSVRVDITTPQGKPFLLVGGQTEIGMDKDKEQLFYAKNSVWPEVFTVPRTVYDQVNQNLENYRNRSLFDFESSNASHVDIDGPNGKLSFDRKGDAWAKAAGTSKSSAPAAKTDAKGAAEPPKETTGELKIQNFLDNIHNLRISSYPSDAPDKYGAYGLDKPWFTVHVSWDKGQETILFAKKNGKFYAARQGEASVYELSPNEPPALEQQLKDLAS